MRLPLWILVEAVIILSRSANSFFASFRLRSCIYGMT